MSQPHPISSSKYSTSTTAAVQRGCDVAESHSASCLIDKHDVCGFTTIAALRCALIQTVDVTEGVYRYKLRKKNATLSLPQNACGVARRERVGLSRLSSAKRHRLNQCPIK